MSEDIFASEGAAAEAVTTAQNAPGSPVPTPILEITPERGQFLRFLNRVAKGQESGIPIYMDLRDANGDPLPTKSELFLAIEPSGHETTMRVSEALKNISQYNQLSVNEQRNVDNVDSVKVELQNPEGLPNGGQPTDKIDVRDIDTLYLLLDSPAQIDHSNSEIYIDSNAVEQHGRR
ncbi:hypothetical protein ACOZ4F_14985 [Haloarcula marismortui]|uniref:hypothetical protein n=1 Tax=Haloarcula marismortui TaxID=2238 RepID=UPI003C779336